MLHRLFLFHFHIRKILIFNSELRLFNIFFFLLYLEKVFISYPLMRLLYSLHKANEWRNYERKKYDSIHEIPERNAIRREFPPTNFFFTEHVF